jgi:6 kDa early secretory antigenic target
MSDGDGRSLEVDHATLRQVANDIRSAEEDIQGLLGTVRGAAETLGSSWTGQAASAFTNLMVRWDGDTKKLVGAMSDIAGLLDKAANAHQMTDEASMQALGRIDSGVNNILNPAQ